jgi:hypothetical protein
VNSPEPHTDRWIRYEERVDGRRMTGLATTGPDLEFAVIEHAMSDGSIMRETVCRPVAPPSEATSADTQETQPDASA